MKVLVGRDQPRAEAAASTLGWAEVSTDWRQVLERKDVHLIDICTPGDTHAEIAEAALDAGKHVLVEKPMANSWPRPSGWSTPPSGHGHRGSTPWWGSPTGECQRSSWPAS